MAVQTGLRRLRSKWLLLCLLVLCGVVAYFAFRASCEQTPAVSGDRKAVVELLAADRKEEAQWEKRNNWGSSHITALILSDRAVCELFPVSYARERLIRGGASVRPALMSVLKDSDCASLWKSAGTALVFTSGPEIISDVRWLKERGALSDAQADLHLTIGLPTIEGLDADFGTLDQLSAHAFEEVALRQLDRVILRPFGEGGMYPGTFDPRLSMLLNRIYDLDLDAWLGSIDGDVVAFRNRELGKGYDPIMAFERLLYETGTRPPVIGPGIRAVFPDSSDQKACFVLLSVVYDSDSKYRPKPADGWEARLKTWYIENRPKLRYDASKRRFVVGD